MICPSLPSDFYQTLTPESVTRFGDFYSADAYFKDPFNEVHGLPAIRHIFAKMFEQLEEPRFVITEKVDVGDTVVLVWEFSFRIRHRVWKQSLLMRGVSHLKFDATGKVCFHRDYWDTAEELYMKLPVLGGLMRTLQRSLSA